LKPPVLLGTVFTVRKDFHFWWVVRDNVNEMVKADKLVMHDILSVTASIAHYVVEEMSPCVDTQNSAA
jgi:hypothetical protein